MESVIIMESGIIWNPVIMESGYLDPVTWLPGSGYLVTWLPGYLVTWLPGYLVLVLVRIWFWLVSDSGTGSG